MAKKTKLKKLTIEDLMHEVSKVQAALGPVLKLNETLQQLQPTMNQLLGELRAVRILLDEKKQYAFMDKPRVKPEDQRPIPESLGLPRL